MESPVGIFTGLLMVPVGISTGLPNVSVWISTGFLLDPLENFILVCTGQGGTFHIETSREFHLGQVKKTIRNQ